MRAVGRKINMQMHHGAGGGWPIVGLHVATSG